MAKIVIKDLTFSYGNHKILDKINISVHDSEMLSLAGPNGSGKTTLIKCIDRILKPNGSILLDGNDIESLSRQDIARTIGYVPQGSSSLLSTTVFDTVLMGRRPHIRWRVSENDLDKVTEVLQLLHLDDLAMMDFGQLSGGQKQKILIARALAQEPSVLLLDEPTSNLDIRHQLEVMEIISDLVKGRRISAIMAIHDLNLAARFSDRLALLRNGMLCAEGPPDTLLTAENMLRIFEVEVEVVKVRGSPCVIPLRSLRDAESSIGPHPGSRS